MATTRPVRSITAPTAAPARWLLATLAAALLLLTGAGLAGLADPAAASRQAPPRPIIVDVTGDAENGFGVHYADGSEIFPPTTSEMIAECGEYDTRVQRVSCRAVNRTWYRDLADLRRSLAWERAHG